MSSRDLSIEYRSSTASARHLAVKGVSFDLGYGEVLGVVGESGSGKSTLAATIAGLADRGSNDEASPRICGGGLSVFDTELRGIGGRARRELTLRIGYLAQDGAQRLNSSLTIAENVAEPIFLRDRRFDAREAGQAAATLIDAVHLPLSILERRPFELSSGQRQRVALARALILEPGLLVADEPIRGVDIMVRHDVLAVIPELQAERGFSAIVVSSDLSVITEVAERIAVMHDGVVIGIGSPEALAATPDHPYVKALAREFIDTRAETPVPRAVGQADDTLDDANDER
ncbi:ATP-binding cassette domain-containing protein [Marisediminicola sp. LYQ134]|uniref:ATP-binding cassette domain-containing protein n=1 Tax=Marisediminicola sp. LYQ134 TaxID=3391061 RepID=UPI0039832941